MTKWEYRQAGTLGPYGEFLPWLNEQGQAGWELVSCSQMFVGKEWETDKWDFDCIFKRAIPLPMSAFTGGTVTVEAKPVLEVEDELEILDESERWDRAWQKVDEYTRDRD